MAGYMITLTKMNYTSWIEAYRAAVAPMIARHGGEYLAVGLQPEILEGTIAPLDGVVVFRFPSLEAVRSFINSEEYRPWRELRQGNSDATLLAFESTI